MNGQTAHPQVQTLGRCLSQIRAGDPCPCCGARLAIRHSGQSSHPVPTIAMPGAAEAYVLLCSECGCEISAEDGADHVFGRRSFGVAA